MIPFNNSTGRPFYINKDSIIYVQAEYNTLKTLIYVMNTEHPLTVDEPVDVVLSKIRIGTQEGGPFPFYSIISY